MKISTLRRSVSGAAAVALVAAGVAITAAPASAANLGALYVSPRTGNALNVPSFVTPSQCASGDTVKVTVIGGSGTGAVLASAKNIVGVGTADTWFQPAGGMKIDSPSQWSTFAATNGLTALNGTYTMTAVCGNGDTMSGTVTFTGTDLSTNDLYAGPLSTATTFAAPTSTPSGFGYGSAINFSASVKSTNVTPAAVDSSITGSVQFKEGTTVLATGTVNAATGVATATYSGSPLATGNHTFTAVYVPDSTATAGQVSGSTSGTQSATIVAGTGTISVSAAGSSAHAGESVQVTATCGPAAVSGSLSIAYVSGGSTPIYSGPCTGAAPVVTTWNISAGQAVSTGTIVATFTPTDTVNYSTPSPASTPFQVLAALGINNGETIQVNVPNGALSATIPANPLIVLGNWTLDASGRFNTATGALNPIVITDTRAGDLGWNLKAKALDFVPCSTPFAPSDTYNAVFPSAANDPNQPTSGTNTLPGTGLNLGGVYLPATAAAVAVPGCSGSSSPSVAPASGYAKAGISANNLGIAPSIAATTSNPNLQGGTVFQPNDGLGTPNVVGPDLNLPGSAPSATLGLLNQKTLLTATGGVQAAFKQYAAGTTNAGQQVPGGGIVVGSATGVAQVNGVLTLRVPTVTVAGAYATVLTLTVASN